MSFNLVQITQLGVATARVRFGAAPKVESATEADDALNPSNYILSGPTTNYVTSVLPVVGDATSVDLFLAAPLAAGAWELAVTSIVSDESAALSSPTSINLTATIRPGQDPLTGGATNSDIVNVLRKHFNRGLKGASWDSFIQGLAAGDATNARNAKLAFDQMFTSTASGSYLDRIAGDQGIRRPAGVEMSDELFRDLAIIQKTEKLTQQSILDVLEVFYGRDALHAFVDSTVNEPYALEEGDELRIVVDGIEDIVISFTRNDFASMTAALAIEVAAVITRGLRTAGSQAFATAEADPTTGELGVRIYSGSLGLTSSIEITGGRVQTEMLFIESIAPEVDPAPPAPPSTPLPVPLPPPFLSDTIDGLYLWLDAANGVTTVPGGWVSQWDDQSGNGRHVYQADQAARFKLMPTEMGGAPSLAPVLQDGMSLDPYDGSGLLQNNNAFMANPSNLFPTPSHPFTMFVVAQGTDNAIDGGVGHGPFLQLRTSARVSNYGFTHGRFPSSSTFGYKSYSTSTPFGQIDIVIDRSEAADLHLYQFDQYGSGQGNVSLLMAIDNQGQSTNAASVTTPNPVGVLDETGAAGFMIGGTGASISPTYVDTPMSWQGYLAEIIVFGRVLNATEVATVNAYLNAKYPSITLAVANTDPVVWLESDSGVMVDGFNQVTSWIDKSPAHRVVEPMAAEVFATPLFTLTPGIFGAQPGLVSAWTGSTLDSGARLGGSGIHLPVDAPRTAFIVFQGDPGENDPEWATLLSFGMQNPVFDFGVRNIAGTIYPYTNSPWSPPYEPLQHTTHTPGEFLLPHLLTYRFFGSGKIQFAVDNEPLTDLIGTDYGRQFNGMTPNPYTLTGEVGSGGQFAIGGFGNASAVADHRTIGSFGAVVLHNSALSDPDVAAWRAYLMAKYRP